MKFYNINDTIAKKIKTKEYLNFKVLKYTRNVFQNQDFNDIEVMDSRGVVVNNENEIVSLPFRKIFNYGENFAPNIDLSKEVIGVKKMNGFMLSLSRHNGDILFSTTGSLDSDFVKWGKEFFNEHNLANLDKNYTYMFEVCHKLDPHIVYEEEGAYLIGVRLKSIETFEMKTEKELDDIAVQMNWKRPHWRIDTFESFVNENSINKTEGYIIRDNDKNQTPLLKLKTDWYIFCKILARSDKINVAEKYVKNNKEYQEILEFVKDNKAMFFALNEQERLKALNTKTMPQIEYNGDLILVRGVAGAGKSTFVNLLKQNNPNIKHFEADDYFIQNGVYSYDRSKIGEAHKDCQYKTSKALKDKNPVIIVSNTFTTQKEMQFYVDLAQKHRYKLTTLVVENRHNSNSIHNVPSETIEKMKARFQIKL